MLKDLTPQAITMGLLAGFTGYAASFAIVLAGLTSVGATPSEAATGLFFATLAMGLCSIWLAAVSRAPVAVAWSTPGAAFLAATAALPGGFAEATGALIGCAVLILLTGLIPALGRLVSGIPKPLANALLAGVILKLCLAPALALGTIPMLVLPVIAAWLIGLRWNRMAAMPMAVLAFVVVLFLVPPGADTQDPLILALPAMTPINPTFTAESLISISVPLFLVTMAGQNIPGFAVLELNGYTADRPKLLGRTGLASLAIAPFGSVPINMSAITAAMMAGEDAGPDPAKRYWATIVGGVTLVGLAFGAAIIASAVNLSPPGLVTAVAGLALIPALVGAISAAFEDKSRAEAPALTFLISASGMTMFGISGAFWALVIGALIWWVRPPSP